MLIDLHRYINQTVEIIYLDQQGCFSQRKVKLISIEGAYAKAYCFKRRCARSFLISSILSVRPASNFFRIDRFRDRVYNT